MTADALFGRPTAVAQRCVGCQATRPVSEYRANTAGLSVIFEFEYCRACRESSGVTIRRALPKSQRPNRHGFNLKGRR